MSRRSLLWRVAACAAVVVLLGVLVSRSPSMANAGGADGQAAAPSAEVPPPVQGPAPWQPFQAQALKESGIELADTPLELALAASWAFTGRASHTHHDEEL